MVPAYYSAFLLCCLSSFAVAANGANVQINDCNNAALQTWKLESGGHLVLGSDGECVAVSGDGTQDETNVIMSQCEANKQRWKYDASKKNIIDINSGKCLDRSNYGKTAGTNVWLYHCTGAFNQQWDMDTNGQILASDSKLCLDAGSPITGTRPCDGGNAKLPFCNTSLSHEDRIKDLIGRLSESSKVGLFVNGAQSVDSPKLPSYQWWSEALHGVGHSPGVHFGGATPAATSFPQVGLTGASFNRTLFHSIGSTISTEARAMNNVGRAGLTFWAPNINIVRDPRWGRGQETPGEDPFLTAEYAANFVSGMQWGEDKNYLKVSSCCKHFAAYDLENWGGVDRHHFNAVVSKQDMADTYLPAFESCVKRGRGSSLMCAYNAINGVPSCADSDIMTTKARGLWGFEGYITSDCGAVKDVIDNHHYTKTPGETCNAVLTAGMDIDCGGYLKDNLKAAMDDKSVKEATVDNALTNLFAVQFRLGMFDPVASQPYMKIQPSAINTKDHQELALDAARQGIVLLKNEGGALPLDRTTIKTVAVVGPNGAATTVMQGNYAGTAPFLISPVEGINRYATAKFVQGCDINSASTSGIAAAAHAAQDADATVIIVGLDQSQEREGHDRTSIDLPGKQNDLISAVAKAAKGPVTVVVMAGGSVDVTLPRDSHEVAAMLWVGYPGQAGGQAIADVLFGAYNPGGRMAHTVYPANLTDKLSMFDMSMRPNASSHNPGRSYRFYTGKAVFEFGHGLSYTSFNYSSSSSSPTDDDASVQLTTIVQHVTSRAHGDGYYLRQDFPTLLTQNIVVTNTGKVAGSDAVLLFVTPPHPGQNGNPLRSLVGFERIFLNPGESKTVSFGITAHDLTLVGEDGLRTGALGTWKLQVGELVVPISVTV